MLLERHPLVGWVLIGAGVALLGFAVFEPQLRAVLPDLRDHFRMALLLATLVAMAYDVDLQRASTRAGRVAVIPTTDVAEVVRLGHELAVCKAAAARVQQPGAMISPTPVNPARN